MKREGGGEVSTVIQKTAARGRSDQMGATWVDWYEDLGISAFSGTERPGFDRLVADCHSGRINMIIVYYISRLSRLDPLDAIPVVTDLLNRGVTIVSVAEGEFRRGNLVDLIHLIMRLDQAHGESKTKSINVKAAKALARDLGGYVSGKAPYGFALTPEVRRSPDGRPITIQLLIRNDFEVAIIRRMFDWMLSPTSPATVGGLAAALNAANVPTRGQTTGKLAANSAWRPRTVNRILRDPRIAGYAAEVVYSTRKDGRQGANVIGYRLVRDESGEPVRTHPALVDPHEWYTVQAILDGKPSPVVPLRRDVASLLGSLGVLRCECGSLMKSHRINDVEYKSTYLCNRAPGRRLPGTHSGGCAIAMLALDDYIARRIFALIATAEYAPDTLDTIAEATRRFGVASADPAVAAQRGAIAGELDDAERTLTELYDDRAAGGYSGTIGKRRFLDSERSLSGRIDLLTAQLAEIDNAASPTLPIGEWLGEPGSDPLGPGSWWAGASLAERRTLVATFVGSITVRKSATRGGRGSAESRVSIEWARPAEDV
ncbi:hypothetical protein GCM10012279_29530 [Micromonospora yangpuensis]|uniref:Recombinase n=1 Tax=Micromonospora yangpuensis TaxID=683228 RepID=A0A1C6UNG5_9ACTN|nr:hypothetical protein GCM10012279_29530 [Micromonospora yangpuensis]SCL55439.1 Recombinase [Micromonospora yangpuensis]